MMFFFSNQGHHLFKAGQETGTVSAFPHVLVTLGLGGPPSSLVTSGCSVILAALQLVLLFLYRQRRRPNINELVFQAI